MAEGKELAPEDLQLSDVDKTVTGGGFAYSRLVCTGQKINDLGILTQYPFIRKLDLSQNCIKDVRPVSALRHLLSLNLASNQISSTEWTPEDLPHLLFLDLNKNQLEELPPLHMPALRRADLRDNAITSCSKFLGHATLQTLQLSGNQLPSVTGLRAMPKLEVLELGRNALADLEGLAMLPSLATLDISGNKFETLKAPWHEMDSLVTLDCSSNGFAEVPALQPLSELQKLRSLTINGCPLEEQDGVNVRLEILIFRPLQLLNGEEVTPEEQDEANALHEKRVEEAERLRQEEEARLEEERLAEEARLAEAAAQEGQADE